MTPPPPLPSEQRANRHKTSALQVIVRDLVSLNFKSLTYPSQTCTVMVLRFFMWSSTRNSAFANISGPPAMISLSRLAWQLIWTLSSVPTKLFFAKRENRRDLKCDYFSIYCDFSSFYVRLGNITGLKFSYMQVSMAVAEVVVCEINRVLHTHTHKTRQPS